MKPLSILLTDDDVLYRRQLGQELQAKGHHLLYASNGQEAIQLLRRKPIDLLITDYQMPLMDGARLALALRPRHDFPILLCSGAPRLIPDMTAARVEIFAKSGRLSLHQRIQTLAETLPTRVALNPS